MDDNTGRDWRALGAAVVRRRIELGLNTREELAQRMSLSYRALTDLENGKRPFSMNTLSKVEQALDWPSGTSVNILEGNPEPEGATAEDYVTIHAHTIPLPQIMAIMEAATRARSAADAVQRETNRSPATTELISATQELGDLAVRAVQTWFGGPEKLQEMAATMNSFIADQQRK